MLLWNFESLILEWHQYLCLYRLVKINI